MSIWSGESPTVLVVPGLRGHDDEHWQTILAGELPRARVVPAMGRDNLDCAARVEAIEREAQAIDGPIVLVAHSAGAIMVAHWAMRSTRRVLGALLAVPPDFERAMPAGYPSEGELREGGWLPVPRNPLPFASIVAASRNDPLADYARVKQLACDWGSRLVDLGDAGHLNPASGYGRWERAHEFIDDIIDTAIAVESACWAQPLRC